MTTDGNPILVLPLQDQWYAYCPTCKPWDATLRATFEEALADRGDHHHTAHALVTR